MQVRLTVPMRSANGPTSSASLARLVTQKSIVLLKNSANLLPLTPISAFRPRRWRGALLPSSAEVVFEILEPEKRPVAAVADFTEVRDVASVAVTEDREVAISVLFDPDQGLSERIIAEQFTV